VLTSLEPPSPASSAGPHEVEVTPPRPLQAAPQLAGLPSIVSSLGLSSPKKPRNAPNSSNDFSSIKRWLQARFEKTNKNQGTQLPDQLSTRSGRPVNLRLNSKSRPTENTTKKGPPRMAAGQRVRVSIFFIGRQTVMACLTSYLSERSQNPSTGFVV